jgi:hypothetical protein
MIFVDYDSVLVSFEKAAFKLFDREYNEDDYPEVIDIADALDVSKKEFWSAVDAAGVSFWAYLEKYEWSDNLILLVQEYCNKNNTDWRILSAPSLNSSCAAGKVESFQHHFGYHFRKYILAPAADKPLLCRSSNDILIDDRESTILSWREQGGLGILFPQPWNSNRNIKNRLEFVKSELNWSKVF